MEALVGGERDAVRAEVGHDALVVVRDAVEQAAVLPVHDDVERVPAEATISTHEGARLCGGEEPAVVVDHHKLPWCNPRGEEPAVAVDHHKLPTLSMGGSSTMDTDMDTDRDTDRER